ncbi:SEL1-like repeat protein [Buttiauxella sp. A111]|uniref:SEL1-like repeat protein n=1 Tax=Buttiauxella sp. A111 TaxID=2563088 RepID=UPI00160D27BF|nr:SEL1-like repeat protein [Buttiauxella sp. A111]
MSKKSSGFLLNADEKNPGKDVSGGLQEEEKKPHENEETKKTDVNNNAIDTATSEIKAKLSMLVLKAEAGDSTSAYRLAVIYHKGSSVPPDYSKAIYFYKLAAAGGSYQARKMMSLILSGPKDKQGSVTPQWMLLLAGSIPEAKEEKEAPQGKVIEDQNK